MNIFEIPTGDTAELTSNISIDGWPTGVNLRYTAVATDTYAHVNGENFPRRKFVNVTPTIHGHSEIWLGDDIYDGAPAVEQAQKEIEDEKS